MGTPSSVGGGRQRGGRSITAARRSSPRDRVPRDHRSGVPNGTQTLVARATALAAGYWFDSLGTDLATLPLGNVTFGYGTTNASVLGAVTDRVRSELAGGYAGPNCLPGGAAIVGCGAGEGRFFVDAGGQFRLANVPEPATLGLLGLGMVAAATIRRRRRTD